MKIILDPLPTILNVVVCTTQLQALTVLLVVCKNFHFPIFEIFKFHLNLSFSASILFCTFELLVSNGLCLKIQVRDMQKKMKSCTTPLTLKHNFPVIVGFALFFSFLTPLAMHNPRIDLNVAFITTWVSLLLLPLTASGTSATSTIPIKCGYLLIIKAVK